MADAAAQAAAQAAANRRLNETISDLPKFYGTAKDTVSAENLIDRIDASIATLAWTQVMAYNYFKMALHSDAENWLKLIKDTEDGFQEQWDFIKPLFKARFGKKMDVAKVGQVLDNLKMDPAEHVDQFAAKMNTNFSQLRELIPRGEVVNVPAALEERTDAVCAGIHNNAIRHTHLQYLKYFFIAGLPKAIMQLVASKDPATFSEARKEAVKIQDLTKSKNEQGCSAVDNDESVNQIQGNGTQNPYRGNYRGRGGRGRGASRGAPSGRGGYNGNNGNGNGNMQSKGDNQHQNGTKPTCWWCNVYGHRQEDCRNRIKANAPCKGLNGSTYWPKQKASPIGGGDEEEGQQEVQGAVGEMYTGQLATVFSGFH